MVIRSTARQLLRAAGRARELRARRPPPLRVAPADAGTPVVYYLTPDESRPHGGIRVNYRHVDLLNTMGIEAAVLHTRPGFRCDWFAHDTRVVTAGEITLRPQDILVVPEYYAPGFGDLPVGPRILVFNQGAYHTFDYISFPPVTPGAPYTGIENLVAIITVSDDSAALLGYTFPGIPVHRTRQVIDGRVFHPGPGPAGRRIAMVPRRRPQERAQLLHMLTSRRVLDGWELVLIEGRDEAGTAAAMRSSAIFLSFSERDGFGLPPAEAMASGCYVVGFTGQGGRDYFDPEYCSPVPDGDLLAFATAVEDAINRHRADPVELAKAGLVASERILGRYHEAGLRDDLLASYGPLLDPGVTPVTG